MVKQERSELLSLLNSRKAWELPAYKRPVMGLELLGRARVAVQCLKRLEDSDPFVGDRAALYFRQGYCLPSEVLKDCRGRQGIRDREPRASAPVALQVAKQTLLEAQRKVDADKAWNQHRSKAFLEDKAAA